MSPTSEAGIAPFGDVVGHEWATRLLRSSIEREGVPHATLITGPPQVGKSTLGRAFARALNCTAPTERRPCGECLSCRKVNSGNHPDVRVIDSPGESIKIDQLRALQRELSLSPNEGRLRVALLCNFEQATVEAANSLLKTLEEPPRHVAIILTSPDPALLLPTIVSRCQVLSLRPLPLRQLEHALQERWGATAQKAALLARLSAGRAGWAVQAASDEEVLSERDRMIAEMLALVGAGRVEGLAYAQSLSSDAGAAVKTLSLWLTLWRDVMLIAAGSTEAILNLDRVAELESLAGRVGLERARHVTRRIHRAIWGIERNVNLRLAIEVLALELHRSCVRP